MTGSSRRLAAGAATAALAIGLTVLAAGPSTAAAAHAANAPRLTTIAPGHHPMLTVSIPVNIVFVGYRHDAVDVNRMLGQLPTQAAPVVRTPGFFGIDQSVGLNYRYSYRTRFAGRLFDDAFFGHLASSGFVGGPEYFQRLYNEQVHRSLTIGPDVRFVDARSTEAWLEHHAAAVLGIPSTQYTVFLVNWYGRPDFQFHEFTNIGHPDPDTGLDAGEYVLANTRGWGGTSGRSWFYDLSAGPVYMDDSWDVDDADFYYPGSADYRLPPVWEYGNLDAYRPFDDLSGDLAKLVRYVALDMLFTPSPLFDPAATVPAPDGVKQIALDLFEGDPATNGLDDLHPDLLLASHRSLEPYYGIDLTVHDQPLAGDALDAYNIDTGKVNAPGCWSQYGDVTTEFLCFFRDQYRDYFPASGPDAVIPAAGFTVGAYEEHAVGYSGYTDSDHVTGAPSLITVFDTPSVRSGVLGFSAYTHTLMHEAGHFVGLSHPHDGYDPASGADIEPYSAFDFAWAGDASDSVMSYLGGNDSFDVFDRDNMARWHVGRLLDLADTDAAAILAQPPDARAYTLLRKADTEFRGAELSLRAGDWLAAARQAVRGYRDVQRADAAAGVTPASVQAAANERVLLSRGAAVHPSAAVRGAIAKLRRIEAPRVVPHGVLVGDRALQTTQAASGASVPRGKRTRSAR